MTKTTTPNELADRFESLLGERATGDFDQANITLATFVAFHAREIIEALRAPPSSAETWEGPAYEYGVTWGPQPQPADVVEAARALIAEGPTLFHTATWDKLARALASLQQPHSEPGLREAACPQCRLRGALRCDACYKREVAALASPTTDPAPDAIDLPPPSAEANTRLTEIFERTQEYDRHAVIGGKPATDTPAVDGRS